MSKDFSNKTFFIRIIFFLYLFPFFEKTEIDQFVRIILYLCIRIYNIYVCILNIYVYMYLKWIFYKKIFSHLYYNFIIIRLQIFMQI